MANPKTANVDQLEVLRGLVTELGSKLDALRGDFLTAGTTIDARFVVLQGRIEAAEADIGRLAREAMEDRASTKRAIGEAIELRKTEMDALMRHIGNLEREVNGQKTNNELLVEAMSAVVNELGLESQVRLGDNPTEKKLPKLQGIERSSKQNRLIQALIAIGVTANAVMELYHRLFP